MSVGGGESNTLAEGSSLAFGPGHRHTETGWVTNPATEPVHPLEITLCLRYQPKSNFGVSESWLKSLHSKRKRKRKVGC